MNEWYVSRDDYPYCTNTISEAEYLANAGDIIWTPYMDGLIKQTVGRIKEEDIYEQTVLRVDWILERIETGDWNRGDWDSE